MLPSCSFFVGALQHFGQTIVIFLSEKAPLMNFIRLIRNQFTSKVNEHVATEPERFCLTSAFPHIILFKVTG